MNRFQLFSIVLLLASLYAHAQKFEVDTLQYTGDINQRINLVLLGDGYQEFELPQFVVDANKFVDYFFSVSPYSEYQSFFNVFAIKVPSNESGASFQRHRRIAYQLKLLCMKSVIRLWD